MTELNEAYWTQRYIDNTARWDMGAPSRPLIEYCEQLEDRSLQMLIPGAGNSYEAEALWGQGFSNLDVVDISAKPLENLKRRAPKVDDSHLIHQDFFALDAQYDLILEQTFFCALNPELRPKYAEQMGRLIKPGGKLVGVWFDFPLTEQGPPFGGSAEEYRQHLSPFFNVLTLERCYNSMPGREGKELFIIAERKKNPA